MSEHTLEERLARSLDQQAGGLHDAPFTVDDVRGRARSIRRRRRGVGVAAAAAVLAIVAPVAALTGPGEDRSRGVDPAPAPGPVHATVLHDGELTLPDGQTLPLPYDDAYQVAALADGRTALMLERRVVVLDASGTETASYPVLINTLTTGNEGTVAWIGADRHVQVLEPDRPEPTALAQVPADSVRVEAILGSRCWLGACRALVGDGNRISTDVFDDEAQRPDWDPPFAQVTDVNDSGTLWAVQLPPGENEQYGCSALYAPVEGELVATSCETSGLRFAPDGEHLRGMRGDNQLYGEVEVVDLDLRPVFTYEPAGDQAVSSAAWAGSGHLEVAVVDLDLQAWTLVRVPVDGGPVEVLAGPAAGPNPEDGPDFLFAG